MNLKFPAPKTDAVKSPQRPGNDPFNGNVPAGLKTFAEWQAEAQEAEAAIKAEKKAVKEKKEMQMDAREKRERAERYVLLKMGRQLQDNIITAGRLTERIIKAVKEDRPPEEIALLATKGLALLVNDPLVFKYVADKYRAEYGLALDGKPPYEIKRLEPNKK